MLKMVMLLKLQQAKLNKSARGFTINTVQQLKRIEMDFIFFM